MKKIISIGTDQYMLELNINAMSDYEELTGNKLTNLDEKSFGIRELRVLFHVALVEGNQGYSLADMRKTGKLLSTYIDENEDGFEILMEIIGELLNAAVGKQKRKTELAKVTK